MAIRSSGIQQFFMAASHSSIMSEDGMRRHQSHHTEDMTEDESGESDSDVELTAKIEDRIQDMQMQKLLASKIPEVPPWPAPPAGAAREPYRGPLPQSLIMLEEHLDGQLREKTALDRMLNSSIGRSVVFIVTIILFSAAATGVVIWNTPVLSLGGHNFPVLAGTCCIVAMMYTLVPKVAERTGMNPRESGWKPYFVVYRLAYVTALPSLVLLGLGYGHQVAFGQEALGSGRGLRISDLTAASFEYFEAVDGFVALNLTIGIAETLMPEEHGSDEYRRFSRFRDAELRINTEPFSDIPEPTTPPGLLTMYRIAPIFTAKASCISRYRTTVACLNENPVHGWAISRTQSLCSNLRVVACKSPEPELKPVYQCTTDSPIQGDGYVGDAQGLCGRVIKAPRQGVIDELSFLLSEEAWPQDTHPNSTSIWVDVSPDACIGDVDTCNLRWSYAGIGGVVFAVVTCCFVAIPAVLDCIVDRWIRKARHMIQQNERFDTGL